MTDFYRYTGSNCQNRINLCDSGPCRNGATCQDHSTHYTCHCPYGFAGKDCSDYVDWCATDPCENQASCYQVKNQYSCTCGPGWTGKVCDVEMVSCQDAALRKGNTCCSFFKTSSSTTNISRHTLAITVQQRHMRNNWQFPQVSM